MVITTNTHHVLHVQPLKLQPLAEKHRQALGVTVTHELDRRLKILFQKTYDAIRLVQMETGLKVGLLCIEGISRGHGGRSPDARSVQAAGCLKAVAFALGRPVYSASVLEVRQTLGLKGKVPKERRFEAARKRFCSTCTDHFDWKSEHVCDALTLAEVGLVRCQTLEGYSGH